MNNVSMQNKIRESFKKIYNYFRRSFFYRLLNNVARCYSPKNLYWQILGVALTVALVASGFDGWYFTVIHNTLVYKIFTPASIIGFFVPGVLWLLILIDGLVQKNSRTITAAWMSAQAGVVGFCVSSFYKVFTGRIPPPLGTVSVGRATVLSHVFQFGILRGGIFSGWPSSHTTVAFAMMVALAVFYSDKKGKHWVAYLSIIYALYIAIGVSMQIHWFSDVIVGIILGTIIGFSVGNSFQEKYFSKIAD